MVVGYSQGSFCHLHPSLGRNAATLSGLSNALLNERAHFCMQNGQPIQFGKVPASLAFHCIDFVWGFKLIVKLLITQYHRLLYSISCFILVQMLPHAPAKLYASREKELYLKGGCISIELSPFERHIVQIC